MLGCATKHIVLNGYAHESPMNRPIRDRVLVEPEVPAFSPPDHLLGCATKQMNLFLRTAQGRTTKYGPYANILPTPHGSTFPGFMIPCGSKADLMALINPN